MNIPNTPLSLLDVTISSWYADWLWGLPLIVLTVVFHAFGLLLISERVEQIHKNAAVRYGYPVMFVVSIGGSAMLAAVLHGVEGMMWAGAYLAVGALPDYKDAALYSLSAMTTYGDSNLHLEKHWRLLGALEALDGMLLFGLTTAFLFGIIQKTRDLTKRSPQ
jgi:hypothetical protein